MNGRMRFISVWLVLAATTMGCATTRPATTEGQAAGASAEAARSTRPKHVTASIMGEPTSFVARLNATQISLPGGGTLEQLVNATMLEINGEGKMQPELAEAAPTLENGLWQLFPDGRMATSWKIRAGSRWHDGTPLTGDDFVFAMTVDQDKEIPTIRPPWYPWVDSITAPDPQTVTLTWNRPFIDADRVFTNRYVTPLPRHLLEDTYLNDKSHFLLLPYWTQEYVGTGPFTVASFTPGSSIVLRAFDGYVYGRPKIDEIEVRPILELNTLMTNLLAGTIELTLGRGFAVEQALQLRNQWQGGHVETKPRSWIVIHPQFIGANTPVVTNLDFRRALMYGTDRQELVDTIQGGLTSIAHLYLPPSEPEYAEVQDAVVRYEYDPRRAAQLIEGLGYTKGSDGIYRSAAGERLSLELRSNGEPVTEKTIVPVANFWTQLGIPTEPMLIPPQRINDREYVATFPSLRMMRQGNEAYMLNRQHSSQIPRPETNFVGTNYARYTNDEWDALIDRFLTTIPHAERIQALRAIMRHMSENLNLMGMFYDADFICLSNRLDNITAEETRLWNIQNWDVKS
jgi:peptide/nickel transport system substrate-binding protein